MPRITLPDGGRSGPRGRDRDRRGLLALAVGLLLVTTPLWAPALNLTGDRVTYRATAVEPAPDGEGFAFATDDVRFRTGMDEVACDDGLDYPRECALEAALANDSGIRTASGGLPVVWTERFVRLRGPDAGLYRRTPPVQDPPEGDRLGLEPVDAATVLSGIAVDPDGNDRLATRAIETGSVTVHEDRVVRAAGQVYRVDGTYYLVYEAGRRTPLVSKDPAAARFVEAVAVVAGLVALVRGLRTRR